jgi:hypothetical protein
MADELGKPPISKEEWEKAQEGWDAAKRAAGAIPALPQRNSNADPPVWDGLAQQLGAVPPPSERKYWLDRHTREREERATVADKAGVQFRGTERPLEKSAVVNSGDTDKDFWVAITAFGTILGAGVYVLATAYGQPLFEWLTGGILTAGGGGGLLMMSPRLRTSLGSWPSRKTLIIAIAMTWLFLATNLGFAVYDHFWPVQSGSAVSGSPERWPALTKAQTEALSSRVRFIPPEEITVACETLNCRDLSDGIADVLQKTPGWKVSILHRGGLDIDGVAGIEIDPDEPATQALKEAIEATTGLAVTVGPDARKDFGNGPALLVVGIRPF